MTDTPIPAPRLLAEILRLQRWAGGEAVSSARIFGLMHGFETVIRQECECFGISKDTQRKVEDILEDVEHGRQSTDGPRIKDRLYRDGVDETDAGLVIQLCRLQSRFPDGIEQLINGRGSIFSYLSKDRLPEQDWSGALHYMELVDCTEGARNKMYAVFAPTVPRVGEIVSPQKGSTMKVVDIDHVVISQGSHEGISQHFLVPHVLLEAIEEDEENDGKDEIDGS